MSFKEYIKEETTTGDIATVDNKLNLVKKCKKHKKENCQKCKMEEADNFQQKIKQLIKFEKDAKIAQSKIDSLNWKWNDLNEEIMENFMDEWKEYTKTKGLSQHYTFGDVLA